MPKLTFPAAGEAMPAAEGMHFITGRFSRRTLLVGIVPAALAASVVPALTLIAPVKESREARRRRLQALLESLPPEQQEFILTRFGQIADHVRAMQASGADSPTILAYIRRRAREEVVL
ncbi:hypothetical protein [Mesorhizobium carmichaelinearum]|uniref:hypothetical protein n=1 Tax=Mesorhizobium carmichaelinearum TaxID=1208188 RepID=UPI00117FA428|nr:hypothetical protein [Mesorhizobium carmichaelinearum]